MHHMSLFPQGCFAKLSFLICFNPPFKRFYPRSHVQRGIRIFGLTRNAEGNPSGGIKVILLHFKLSVSPHIYNFKIWKAFYFRTSPPGAQHFGIKSDQLT